jgi:uncharacterized protein (TIGR00730 family)
MTLQRICVFCGSSDGRDPEFVRAAQDLGAVLASEGIGLVYGGARVGLMGVLADSVIRRGGSVVGVIPRSLVDREIAHEGVADLRIVDSMHERKALMADLADAFLALPGGLGTLEEFAEILTWAQLRIHTKPCGLLNVGGYFDPLLAMLDRAEQEGFLRGDHRSMIVVSSDASDVLMKFRSYAAPPDKWGRRTLDGRDVAT